MDKRDIKDDVENVNEEAASQTNSTEEKKQEKETAIDVEDVDPSAKLKEELESANIPHISMQTRIE